MITKYFHEEHDICHYKITGLIYFEILHSVTQGHPQWHDEHLKSGIHDR